MDGDRGGSLGAWLIDAGAAAVFAAAAALAGGALLGRVGATVAASLGLAAAFLFMRSVKPAPARHRLPAFTLSGWPDDLVDVLELTEPEPLLLEDVLTVAPDSRVVQLFSSPQTRSPGGPLAREDAVPFKGQSVTLSVQLPVDASAALRQALADLRRSLP